MRKILLFILVIAITTVLIFKYQVFYKNSYDSGSHNMETKLDIEKWGNNALIYQKPYIRLNMIDDVVKNHISKGLDKEEVIKILGKPTDTPYFREYDLVYWLGEEKSFISIDSSWLVIELNNKNKISGYKLVTD